MLSTCLATLLPSLSLDADRRRERGATAVEYGLLIGLIAVVIIVAVTLLGTNLTAMFNTIATKLPHVG